MTAAAINVSLGALGAFFWLLLSASAETGPQHQKQQQSIELLAPPCRSGFTQLCVSENNCSGRKDWEGCVVLVSIPPKEDVIFGTPAKPTTLERWGLGALAVGIVSLSGVFGACLWPLMHTRAYSHLMRALIGLAVGSLTSTALFQLIPEGFGVTQVDTPGGGAHYLTTALFSWLSVWMIFIIEALSKIILKKQGKHEAHANGGLKHNGHQHIVDLESNNLILSKVNGLPPPIVLEDEEEEEAGRLPKKKVAGVAWMVIFGDGIHNFIDGMSIGAGFSQSIATGLGLTLAIICEEFPHELGDFAILVQSGMSIKRALMYNFLSACTAYLGLALGLWLGQLEGSNFIFAFAGGLFLYISLTHLVPELQSMVKEELDKSRIRALVALLLQNLGMLLGTVVIYFITRYNEEITNGL